MALTTYGDFRQALESGRTTCLETTQRFVERCKRSDLNAFIHLDEENALERAAELDLIDRTHLPVAGMVVGVKDVLNSTGMPVTCASNILRDSRSLYDATAVERLKKAGAIVLGKLNCDEFAMGSSNENSAFGVVRNPVNREYVPGGSSGGSAAAVAGDLCHVTLGSDTGGSIRQPASFCGVVGLKPTYGRVSRYGLVAFASSLDSVGPLANSVDDVALALSVIAGKDDRDATSASVDVPPAAVRAELPRRVGVPREYFGDSEGLDPETRALIEALISNLSKAGAEIVDVSLPHTEYGVATYYIIASAEASSNLARFDGVRYGYRAASSEPLYASLDDELSPVDAMYTASRTVGFGTEVKRRIMLGTYALSSGYYDAYYDKAQRVRSLIRRDFDNAFDSVDVILSPVTPTPAFRLGEKVDDVMSMYLSDIFTVPSSLAGLPGVSIPIGHSSSGLPIGAQLIGPAFSEGRLLSASSGLLNL
ncbi:MAG: Asp-tRNA(Asn)/Glu-tRNA(Gln) amidotransferase subunit GatA [Rhodothermales bacterium]|nr:Asp-tRNA(Asn)/Glu-tRNA(Gln) amidotransferase subunit GatA [Rhodothermales bacterium]